MGSDWFGLLISAYMARPVVPVVHLFSHSSLKLFFKICVVVEMLQDFSGCSFCVPALAKRSAVSFPGISECPGIHWRVTLMSNEVRSLSSFFDRC